MPVQLDHLIIRSRDKRASAAFLTEMLGLPPPAPVGPGGRFHAVRLGSTRIVIQPSVDYFIAPRLSIGLQLGVDHLSISYPPPPPGVQAVDASNGGTTLAAEARVGYAVPLTDTVSIWPRLGVGYTHTSTTYVYTSAVPGYSVPLSVTVPFLWHPGSHFFVGAGPAFVTQLVNKSAGVSGPKTTDYGITALIGGAIGAR